jgi:glycosyltransferase involved in cell wall biosynthesis
MRPETGTALAGKRICLVSSGHIGSNPRLVKEADALHEAGARVHVIALDITRVEHVQQRDRAIIESAPWSCDRVSAGGTLARKSRSLAGRIGKALYRLGLRQPAVLHWAYHPMIAPLGATAARTAADLYIAHNLAALPAAARAAKQHGARLGFDAEDFHSGQLSESPQADLERRLTRALENAYLPQCEHLTAASPGIARAYARACGVPQPEVVLNVFPKIEAPQQPTPRGSACSKPSLYWFSQTVGPDRGLETVVRALALSTARPTLFIRGSVVPGYEALLKALAAEQGVADRIVLLPPALPGKMIELAASYDIGIASEPGHTANNRIALSNKLFTFMLAGLPVLASDTEAQAEIARVSQGAVFIYPKNMADQLARQIDRLCLQPAALSRARHSAWQKGQQRYNWDAEKQHLLEAVVSALQAPMRDRGKASQ